MPPSQFFSKYPEFEHDPLAPLLDEFEKLSLSRNWQPDSKRYNKERRLCVIHEVKTQFSESSAKLQAWQALLVELELEIEPIPKSITQCKKVLNGVYVNLIDLLDTRRAGSGCPRKFVSRQALKRYSKKFDKICPRRLAKEDGFIKVLLIHMF